MKKWQYWLGNLSREEVMWLTAVFLSAMLGTTVSSGILQWGLNAFNNSGVLAKLAVCLLATAAYGGAVVAVFSILLPQTRVAFKRLFINKK